MSEVTRDMPVDASEPTEPAVEIVPTDDVDPQNLLVQALAEQAVARRRLRREHGAGFVQQ